MIQLTRNRTVFQGSAEDLDTLRATFDQQHWLRLPHFVEPALLKTIQNGLPDNLFQPFEHHGIGEELVVGHCSGLTLLTFLTNDPRLLDLVGHITSHKLVASFTGRIYRLNPSSGHYDSWHDDLREHRLIAMSLNLATQPHRGGILQIRDRASKQVLQEVTNTTYGDAIIFRLGKHLQHRVTPVEGTVPRTAFAGWFMSHPPFAELLEGH